MKADVRALSRRAGLGLALGALSGMLCKDVGLESAISYSGTGTALVLAFAVVGAAASLLPARLARFTLAVPAALALLWLVVALSPLSHALLPFTERADPEQPGDAVFVFSSNIQPNGEPDTAAMARMFHGVEEVALGRAPVLVVSEVHPGHMAEDLARAWVSELHLAAEVVDVGPVTNTHDEAVRVAKLARARGWRHIVAVTSPTHSSRACATLENEGLVAVASPAFETWFDVPALPKTDDRLKAFGSIVHELVGSWTYRRRGWIR